MCGISAIISTGKISESLLKDMNQLIQHRGPDGEGLFFNQSDFNLKVGFGHRRLSILDLSERGHQPMTYLDRYTITYNGEIYNYIELKAELEKDGYQFNSGTDTEVILAAYDKWGEHCQQHFNGMWSFVLLDNQSKKVFLSRDRFGIKPLYYYLKDNSLYIGSEIKQFTTTPGWQAKLNQQRSYDFLVYGISDHSEETVFKDVFQIRGGHYLSIDLNNNDFFNQKKISPKKWYQPKISHSPINDNEAIHNFHSLIKDSVNIRLRSDVPVGSCLSGGLDSSSIVCLIAEILKDNQQSNAQHTFSACSKHKRFDEKEYIDMVLEQVNANPSFTYPDNEHLFKDLEQISWHQDEPFASTSIFAQWKVFQLAKEQGVTVVLDGQGADELLGGYHPFFKPHLYQLFNSLKFGTLNNELQQLKQKHGYGLSHFLSALVLHMFPEFAINSIRNISGKNPNKPNWLNTNNLNINLENPRNYQNIDDTKSMSEKLVFSTNLPMLLHYEDRDSMAFSLESRVPFLDYRLVEFIFSLPSQYLIQNGDTKYILRKAMEGVIPQRITQRNDKMGFVTPEEIWMAENKDQVFTNLLSKAIEQTNGLISPQILNEFKAFQDGSRPFNQDFWKIISFSAWIQKFGVVI